MANRTKYEGSEETESGKFVEGSRGPLGDAYEAVRSRFFDF